MYNHFKNNLLPLDILMVKRTSEAGGRETACPHRRRPSYAMSDPDEGWAWLRERAAARPTPGGAPRRPPPPAPGAPPGAPPPPLPGPSPAARASAKTPSATVSCAQRYLSNGATPPAAASASTAGVEGVDSEEIVALAQSIARAAGTMEHHVREHVAQRQESESRASASARRWEVVRMSGVELPGKVVGRIGAELVGRGGLPAIGRLQVRPLPPILSRHEF